MKRSLDPLFDLVGFLLALLTLPYFVFTNWRDNEPA